MNPSSILFSRIEPEQVVRIGLQGAAEGNDAQAGRGKDA
jgi:hypothetical protein